MTEIKTEIERVFKLQQANKRKIAQTGYKERIRKLEKLMNAFLKHKKEIQDAVFADFGKNPAETDLTEIFMITTEIKHTVKNLEKWMQPKYAKTPITFFGAKSRIHYVPKGVCLIISPWNYPFQLAVIPLVSAIAAGNCVIIKPSEYSPNTSEFIKKLISELFEENEVAVFEGDHFVGRTLTEMPFDHIFFTGSTQVGQKVMKAASENYTSFTLEMGGKSPVIIDDSVSLKEAVKKIVWGKFLNCGQLCTAPDYLLIPNNRYGEFIKWAEYYIKKFYGSFENIVNNPDYCRIINLKHFNKIRNLFDNAVESGAKIEIGGIFDESLLYISPTIISSVPEDSGIMNTEIFGPVLPVIIYRNIDEALRIINSMPNPLALYIFSKNKKTIKYVLSNTSSGDVLINDVVVHFANPHLPFGGSRHSGLGKAHGFEGFRAFSHIRSVKKQPLKYSMGQLFYPPYTKTIKKLIDFTIKYF